MLRAAIEHLSRNLIFSRRLPPRVGSGRVLVSPDASLKFWRRDLEKAEPRLFDWVQEFVRPKDVVWDIGANLGLFALAAANLSGPEGYVLAVEADEWLADLLRQSAAMSTDKCAKVEVIAAAISDAIGVARFDIAARGRSTNHLSSVAGSTQSGGLRHSVEVSTITIDALLEDKPAPNVIKIDVEGAEYKVLLGSRKLLSTVRPRVLCEVSSENAEPVARLLHSFGYELFDLDVLADSRRPIAVPTFNTLALFRKDARAAYTSN